MLLPSCISSMLPMEGNKTLTACKSKLLSLSHQLVTEKKEVAKKGGNYSTTVLSVLLKNGEFSDDDIRDQMLTFLFAGYDFHSISSRRMALLTTASSHETTSTSTTFAMYLLATHPEIQEKLRVEVQGVLSQCHPHELTDQMFESMPLLSAVVSETLRLWPVAVSLQRT